MTRDEFARFCGELEEYFGRRERAGRRRLALWYERCRNVPGGEVLAWIQDRIEEEQDRMPSNLPRTVLRLWAEWRETHPGRMVRDPDLSECPAPGCEEGLIWVRSPETGYTAVAFCDRCAVRRGLVGERGPGLSNLARLEAGGWVHDPPPGSPQASPNTPVLPRRAKEAASRKEPAVRPGGRRTAA